MGRTPVYELGELVDNNPSLSTGYPDFDLSEDVLLVEHWDQTLAPAQVVDAVWCLYRNQPSFWGDIAKFSSHRLGLSFSVFFLFATRIQAGKSANQCFWRWKIQDFQPSSANVWKRGSISHPRRTIDNVEVLLKQLGSPLLKKGLKSSYTLQGTDISHLWKRKIILKWTCGMGDILVLWRLIR